MNEQKFDNEVKNSVVGYIHENIGQMIDDLDWEFEEGAGGITEGKAHVTVEVEDDVYITLWAEVTLKSTARTAREECWGRFYPVRYTVVDWVECNELYFDVEADGVDGDFDFREEYGDWVEDSVRNLIQDEY